MSFNVATAPVSNGESHPTDVVDLIDPQLEVNQMVRPIQRTAIHRGFVRLGFDRVGFVIFLESTRTNRARKSARKNMEK